MTMAGKKRVALVVAYDGTNYHGWQLQNNGITIEETLNQALNKLTGEDIAVIGASRTDAGVHSRGNIAVFDTESPIPTEKFAYAINARLPEDIRVMKSYGVDSQWHPRHCESRKTYEYLIDTGEIMLPTMRLYAHHVYFPLNVEDMQRAAAYFCGEHDFKSFCQANAQVLSTVRRVESVTVEQEHGLLRIRVTGNGFLYNMVRIMVGTLLEVGFGRKRPEDIQDILEARDRAKAGPTAPAKGLCLYKYEFL